MGDQSKAEIPAEYDLSAKWDACIDLGVRRCVYSSLAGAFTGLLLFRSPVTRWVSVAFGAGVGVGSAYSECSQKFDKSPVISDASPAKCYGSRMRGFALYIKILICRGCIDEFYGRVEPTNFFR
ncbi:hypothetical protein F511_05976 [Dorcoceras hygrometricum]|uniref:MICOS complex subunit MIC10 n=1 Tax=Dorcoceras hygrometricum TaxID=472368 RepID=A0A2Z7DBU1_9LAMI|nr:hypothetical protein F511_05976 [Dorcoceras hygrometricum]